MDEKRLTHLRQLEAEIIHIISEVVAKFGNPVMLHLVLKAFFPSRLPFPLLHVDTGWKFREMYQLRDRMAQEYGFELLVYKNPEGVADKY